MSPRQKIGSGSRSKSGKHRVPASTTASGVASRYANALFDLAQERGGLEQAGADLAALQQAVGGERRSGQAAAQPDRQPRGAGACYAMLWPSGSVPRTIVRNFLGVLASQRRLGALPAIIDEFSSARSPRIAARRRPR